MRSAVRSTWALGTDYKISYFSFLHFAEVLLVSEYNFEEGGFIDWFPFVNRHDKIIITEGEKRKDM
jgi:hypothetical protein